MFEEDNVGNSEEWKLTTVDSTDGLERLRVAVSVLVPNCVEDSSIAQYKRGHPVVLLVEHLVLLDSAPVMFSDAIDRLVGFSWLEIVKHTESLADDLDPEFVVDDLPPEYIPVFDL
ncbi:hypothetical protein [Natronorarus salvus]|uniref:hypothetical protein n=1 Tax=Natronorarus salvus TaxID=3117733 RepID=UPI002F26406D